LFLRPPITTFFPYTTLFRSQYRQHCYKFLSARVIALFIALLMLVSFNPSAYAQDTDANTRSHPYQALIDVLEDEDSRDQLLTELDRKSTRLNSSHVSISYAV